ncbi:MAG: hypothetical protein DI538_23335 [Azospira oryzae]|nr:MAG: hypothetical protein DI538_23335 [Azospira oryzae]
MELKAREAVMNKPTLWLRGRTYSLEELKENHLSATTSFEESTFRFCREWLNGKTEFEIQTSGSTGIPKRIVFSGKQLEASALLTAQALDLKTNYHALVCLDTKYIAGQMMLVRSFVSGMNMIVAEPSANPFAAIDNTVPIDFAALVPYQVQAILDSSHAHRLNSIQTIIIGGAATSKGLVDRIQEYTCQMYATYGMTETLSHIALQRLNGDHRSDYFHPLEGVRLQKDDRDCLVINAPHITRERIITNDIVDLKEDHSFRIMGRYDNVINTGGVKISPELAEEKIKSVFDRLALHNRLFLSALPDEKLGNKVALMIEGDPFPESMLNRLSHELAITLTRFELPRDIQFIKEFVETGTQKINRKKTTERLLREQ